LNSRYYLSRQEAKDRFGFWLGKESILAQDKKTRISITKQGKHIKRLKYTWEAEETLLRAKEGLKSISGILLNLVDQEPEMIEAMLIGKTNLLSLKP
jgi:hypothetical protein